jgi:hypothetical protein
VVDRFRWWIGLGLLVALTAPRAFAGTIAEQRARLPPPAKCTDPIAGVWKSHTYDPARIQWTEFVLEIRRLDADSPVLTGTITNHSWFGPATEVQPPPCTSTGGLEYVVSMDAQGTLTGMDLQFGGIGSWRLDETKCGYFGAGYNLDQFTGTIDPAIQEFQSVNNDGGAAVNDPAVFRRIKCFDDPGLQHPPVAPPPFMPPSSGCGCG